MLTNQSPNTLFLLFFSYSQSILTFRKVWISLEVTLCYYFLISFECIQVMKRDWKQMMQIRTEISLLGLHSVLLQVAAKPRNIMQKETHCLNNFRPVKNKTNSDKI